MASEVTEPIDPEAALAEIQASTPDDLLWRVVIRDDWEGTDVQLRLVSLSRVLKTEKVQFKTGYASIKKGATADDFRVGVLRLALKLLKKRETELNTPDWAALAKKLQDALNGKTD